MGVQGLWQVLEKTGKPVTLESLEGKRLAVDISLWLCQAAAGYNTYSFGTRSPHVQLLISRISKLLYYKIHPIFVFDGKNVPHLKKQVLNDRALRRHMDEIRLSKKQRTMFEQLAKQQLNLSNPAERIAAEQQLLAKLVQQRPEDRFELPELPADLLAKRQADLLDISGSQDDDQFDLKSSGSSSDDDEFVDVSDDEQTVQAILESCKPQGQKLEAIDDLDLLDNDSQQQKASNSEPLLVDQQQLDLQILNERSNNGYFNISQRINLKSTASQPAGVFVELDSTTSSHESRTPSKDQTKKRKSDTTAAEQPSPKKSVLPLTAGTNEDDWLPESVAQTSNDPSKAAKKSKQLAQEEEIVIDNVVLSDCQQMLSFLGLPYLIANGEAEAQCVELERLGLCDGVVTDDSDAWLFGVQKCYKNMFNRRLNVEEFDLERIRSELDLFRTKFIAIAMLSGGDYCHGFDGVGAITALKLIKEVGDVKLTQNEEDSEDEQEDSEEETYEEGFERLQRIRTWLDSKAKWEAKNSKKLFREPKARIRLRKTIETKNEESRIEAFPSEEVYNAYMQPDVNSNPQQFEWHTIQFDDLSEFLWTKIGWTADDLRTHTYGSLDRWNEFVEREYEH